MNDTPMLASDPHQAAWRQTPAAGVGVSPRDKFADESVPRRYSLAALPGIIATWRWRKRFRGELGEMLKANPHMVDDIGLTTQQVEAEIAKPFWRE